MSHVITFRDGSTLEVLEFPHDDGADRLTDHAGSEVDDVEPVVRASGPGWVAVTALERDPETGETLHVARWIDAAEIASTA